MGEKKCQQKRTELLVSAQFNGETKKRVEAFLTRIQSCQKLLEADGDTVLFSRLNAVQGNIPKYEKELEEIQKLHVPDTSLRRRILTRLLTPRKVCDDPTH